MRSHRIGGAAPPGMLFGFSEAQFAADKKCKGCKGTGLRNRGRCGLCGGLGTTEGGSSSLNDPRIRFNWGYHDGKRDKGTEHERVIALSGEQNVKRVSGTFDPWYAAGYERGVKAKKEPGSSTAAWREFSGRSGDT